MNHHIDQLIDNFGRKPKILVVDDQPINIQVIYSVLKNQFTVVMATNGEQALVQAEQHRPELIILDVMLPDIDGYEVCRRLKLNPSTSGLPVIFVTGNDRPVDEQRGFSLGAIDFITKPINAAILKARVRTYVAFKLQTDLLESMSPRDDEPSR